MNTSPSIITPARLRLYLVLLQSMFLVVYCAHLVTPISLEQALRGAFLATEEWIGRWKRMTQLKWYH
jgi:hypothetical protein